MLHPDLASRLLLVLTCCLGLSMAGPAFTRAEQQQEAHVAKVDPEGVQRARIVGGSYFFKPNHIIVKAKVPVELVVTLEPGIVPHTFVLNAPEAGVTVDEELSTDPRTIRFTATAPGKYAFYCKNKLLFFASHRERGQEGILEVVP
jgi:plastocyanin domain-containing protein